MTEDLDQAWANALATFSASLDGLLDVSAAMMRAECPEGSQALAQAIQRGVIDLRLVARLPGSLTLSYVDKATGNETLLWECSSDPRPPRLSS